MPGITFTTRGALRKSALKQANERLILDAIRQNPGVARSDIARLTGLSASSLSFIVGRLKREGLVAEERVENHTHVGRKPTAVRLVEDARLAVAVEVSLSGSTVALADLSGRILRRKVVEWQPNPEIHCQKIHTVIRGYTSQFGSRQILGVGVGLPGTIDRSSGKVVAAENLNWFNVEAGRMLRGNFSLPFYFENNAKLSALAEQWFVEPGQRPLRDFVYIAPLGGLGTGIVTNGHLLQGNTGMAGEFGHIVLKPDGQECLCGNRGCLEQYASDRALFRVYTRLAGHNGGAAVDASQIARLARDGDEAARQALRQTALALGEGFVSLVWVFNPEAIIVGGYYSEAWDFVEGAIWEALAARAPRYILAGLRILRSKHAADAALLGAASLVLLHFFTRFDHGTDEGTARPVVMHAAT